SVPAAEADTAATKPWTVQLAKLKFTDSQALYTTHGLQPQPGLDFAYIQAEDMALEVDSFYNQATTIVLPFSLKATERCGVTLDASGTFAMKDNRMTFNGIRLITDYTELNADGYMGMGDLMGDPSVPLALDASGFIGVPDIRLMFPAFKAYLAAMPDATPVRIDADLSGTSGDIAIKELGVSINRMARLNASGRLQNAFSKSGPEGDLTLSGNIIDVASITKDFLKGSGLSVPPMTLDGNLAMHRGLMKGNLQATTLGGRIALDASLDQNSEGYSLSLGADEFPIKAFMPDLGVGNVTATIEAKGRGFDPFSEKTTLDATADIASLDYMGYAYKDIEASASLANGHAEIEASTHEHDIDFDLEAQGNLTGETYNWTASIDADEVNLYALKFMQEPSELTLNATAEASYSPSTGAIAANLSMHNAEFTMGVADYKLSDVKARFESDDSLTSVKVTNRDFMLNAESPCPLDTIMGRMDKFMAEFDKELAQRQLYADSLQRCLPEFTVYAIGGENNLVNDVLSQSDMRLRNLMFSARNDSSLAMKGYVAGVKTKSVALDSIGISLTQHGNRVLFSTNLDNLPGTMDQFAHVSLDGILDDGVISLHAMQRNIDSIVGYDLGLQASFADSTLTAKIKPYSPVIGYKDWTVNEDNFIKYNFPHKHIDANLHMKGEKSAIAIYTEHDNDHAHGDDINENDDIVLKLTDVHIQDWMSINPWAPPMEGNLSADLKLAWDGGASINGSGSVDLDDFYYNKQKVGDFDTELKVSTNASGMIRADVDLMVNGAKAVTISGALNDSTSTSPFNLDFGVIHFPLAVANPFLPDNMATLSGTLSGTMDIKGDAANPVVNGNIRFDDSAIKLTMTNTQYTISPVDIPVVDNVVTFTDFGVKGTNDNPLLVNGKVDLSKISDPRINLKMKADNMMIVNSNRALHGANIYGRGYIDLDASVEGNMRFMSVKANLSVLTGTNITYLMTSSASSLQNPQETDMVKFVNFNDTAAVAQADTIADTSMMLALDATLNLQNGNTITVDLGTARDKVEVQATGSVNYLMMPTASDGRITGRININSGVARYAIPVVGEKVFDFNQGSYISFNGDMMNPVLNVHATDKVKTNVTLEGQNSRIVNFDVILGVTGTLEQMDVKFDLETNDDITIANQLQGMTAEQRANQAMNLLLYGMYTGPGSTSNSSGLSYGPLYSFLESQINNWAANNIKGVDLNFGIDQYNQTTNGMTQSTMTYSYQVSKSLFNDRFKIVVGGNYSTDDGSNQNLEQNLVNDISIEYYLNANQTMLVRIFRHTGYESILEGEITQTGVGFVYKRRVNRLVQILPRFMRPAKWKKIR
ncbi:MAG: translocation/assembly module TamB, partial [Clostridium sp.]|nr:translocation/assembly module TamB [Clostridium sp.]